MGIISNLLQEYWIYLGISCFLFLVVLIRFLFRRSSEKATFIGKIIDYKVKLKKAELRGFQKAEKQGKKQLAALQRDYDAIIAEKNALLNENILASEKKRREITSSMDRAHLEEIEGLKSNYDQKLKLKDGYIDELKARISSLEDKITRLYDEHSTDLKKVKTTALSFIEDKEKDIDKRENELIKGREYLHTFSYSLLQLVEAIKDKSHEVKASVYKHDNSLKELAQCALRIVTITDELRNHDKGFDKMLKSLGDASLTFERQCLKSSSFNNISQSQISDVKDVNNGKLKLVQSK